MLQSLTPTDSIEFIDSNIIIEQGASLASQELYQEAIDLYLKVPPNDSNYYAVQLELLRNLNAAEETEETMKLGLPLLELKTSERASFFVTVGNAYLKSEAYDSALFIYEKGLTLYPYHYQLLYNTGLTYYRKKAYSKALEYFQRSITINPFYASSHFMTGYIALLEGHKTKSFLSHLTYMSINNENNGVLITMNNLVGGKMRTEGSIKQITNNQNFDYIDYIIESNVALDPRFKRKVDFDADIAKQSELILSKLSSDPESTDFWMKVYAPVYTAIEKSGLSPALLYNLLESTNNENISSWLSSHKDEESQWIDIMNEYFGRVRDQNTANLNGKEALYSFWYNGSNVLTAIGNQINDDIRIGPWEFYYDNFQLSAKGTYNSEGDKIGTWEYYYDNGHLKNNEVYNEKGSLVEPSTYYNPDGTKDYVVSYDDKNQIHGPVEYYYSCGSVKEQYPYHHGMEEGEGVFFFSTGEKQSTYSIVDEMLEGPYTYFFMNGATSATYHYKKGKAEGKYFSYYKNGDLEASGIYKNDAMIGEWKGFYENKQISYQGTYEEGIATGEWVYYRLDGEKSKTVNFDELGQKNGTTKYFNYNGKLTGEETYNKDTLISYTFYDTKGKVLSSQSSENGSMPYLSYFPTGEKLSEGILVDGKLEGKHQLYFRSGQIFQSGIRKEGEWYGDYIEYYKNGNVKATGSNVLGSAEGAYNEYHMNGNIKQRGNHFNNQATGLWKSYYVDGTLESSNYYEAGIVSGTSESYAVDGLLTGQFEYKEDELIQVTLYDTLGQVLSSSKIPNGTGKQVHKYPNGQLRFMADWNCGVYEGDQVSYYANGDFSHSFSVKYGKYNGPYKSVNSRGNQDAKGALIDGKKTGIWEHYDDFGSLSSKYSYKNDMIDGTSIRYYENGQVESLCDYRDDKKHGACQYYDNAGNLQVTKYYDYTIGFLGYAYQTKDGSLTDTIAFNAKGKFETRAFFQNGKPSLIQHYDDQQLHGETQYYQANGTLVEKIMYNHGENDGVYLSFFENGKPKKTSHYKDDLLEGSYATYFRNGKKKREEIYLHGVQQGYEIGYDENGKLVYKNFYWNGIQYE